MNIVQERNQIKSGVLSWINSREIWSFYLKSSFYLISNMGKVKNILTNKILKTQKNSNGYEIVTIRLSNGQRSSKLVHRLVAETFLSINNKELFEVNHMNGNKNDNSLENLEWMTRQENLQHARDNKLFKGLNGKLNGRYKHGKRCKEQI